MKFFIASDIHGSAYFCEQMLAAFEREKADKLLLLGDILYHGPRNDLPREYVPKKVIALLNPLKEKIFCVRGNCDTEVDQMVLQFPILADYCLLHEKGRLIFVTHGHHYTPKEPPYLNEGDVLLTGHTHIPACEKVGPFVYLNPGSVSIPKEGSKPGYMTLENGVFLWKTLDGQEYNRYEIK